MTPMTSGFGLTQIRQISINAHDLERAVKFYRDTLGMRFLFEVPHMAFFDCGGIRLMIALPDKLEFDHPGSIIYYKVTDIQHAYETLMARGVDFEEKPELVAPMPDHDLWLASFRDTENNLLALLSEVPRQ